MKTGQRIKEKGQRTKNKGQQHTSFDLYPLAFDLASHQWQNLKAGLKWKGSERALEAGLRDLSTPTYYPKLCAWCAAEGVRTVTGYTTVERSSGICGRHLAEVNAELETRNAEPEQPTNTNHEHESRYASQQTFPREVA